MSAWAAFGVVLAFVGSLLMTSEAYAWLPRFAERLVRFHGSRLPEPLRSRMLEEWEAVLQDTPGNLAKVLCAVDLFRAIPKLRHGMCYPGVPYRPVFDSLTRGVDAVAAAVSLVVCLPLMLILIGAIAIESGGPVFARSPRLGRHRRVFVLYTFRTSRICPDCGTEHPYHVTRIGYLLRGLRLDELPLLLNVLMGHMSLVGPRSLHPGMVTSLPPIPPEVFSVRPGLTGRAQISIPESMDYLAAARWRERFHLDVQYVIGRGLRENVRIVLRTVRIVLFGRSDDGLKP